MKPSTTTVLLCLLAMLGWLVSASPAVSAETASLYNARIDAASAGLATKVAPGDLLPISVKLSNFGGGQRVDVLITCSVLDSAGNEIASTTDTVAVETTASFEKAIAIPPHAPSGTYIARTSVVYAGQIAPATSQFSFTVEPRFLGLFRSDLYLYGGVTIAISLCVLLLGNLAARHRHRSRLAPYDYSRVPRGERIFFEILSDTIMQMRLRAGDDALKIASHIDGLTIDGRTGRVLELTDHPAKVIAELVSEYEKLLGKKVSFSLRKETTGA